MEFEQYLEKDIITFLDGKIEKKENIVVDREEEYGMYMTRDYLKELSYALDNDELTKAKRLFDELKRTFSKLPKHSIDRKKMYELLEKMYEKIQNYVRVKEGKIEIIKEGGSEVFKDTTEKFTNIADRMVANKIAIPSEFSKEFEDEKITDLPISHEKNKKSQEHSKNETIEENQGKDKHSDASVESKILGQNIKNFAKEHEDKNPLVVQGDEIVYQNVFIKNKPKNIIKAPQKIIIEDDTIEDLMEGTGLTEWNEDILYYIDRNTEKLDKLKTHVITKLLNDLSKKLEETNNEQETKIEALRKELVEEMTIELNKRLNDEKALANELNKRIDEGISLSSVKDNLRGDIIQQVYTRAREIVSSNDNHGEISSEDDSNTLSPYTQSSKRKNKDHTVRIFIEKSDEPEEHIQNDLTVYTNKYIIDNQDKQFEKEIHELQKSKTKDMRDDKKINDMYEEAIYTMFQSNYDDAAKIFEQILRIKPGNKAAKIRLNECIEAIGNV